MSFYKIDILDMLYKKDCLDDQHEHKSKPDNLPLLIDSFSSIEFSIGSGLVILLFELTQLLCTVS